MAGEADAERLVVLLEARIRDFEKNMQKASGTAGRTYGRMRGDSRSATRQMEQDMIRSTARINQALATGATKIGVYGRAFAGGLIGGVAAGGLAGIVSQIGQIAGGFAEIGDKAKMAGLSNKAFQELGYVAKVNRVEVDALTDGMKELALRADEYIATGKGSAAESFQRLGISAEDLKKKLADPSALFSEIIGKLGQLDKAAQIRISDELFGGTGGEKFVQLIAQGEEGIRATIKEAHNLGAVLSDDVITQAAELDRQFNIVATTVGTALKAAIVEAAAQLQKFIDYFREFDQQATGTLKGRFGELQTRYGQLVKQQGTTEDKMLGWIGKDAATEMTALKAEMDQIAAQLRQRATPMLREKLVAAQTSNTPYVPPATSSTGGRNRAAAQAEREADAVRELIAELEDELRLVGASDEAKRAAEATRMAGAAATDAERQQIVQLNEALHQAVVAEQKAADASQFFQDVAFDAFDALIPVIDTGNDALDRMLNTLIQAVAQAALLGQGPLASLFGGGAGILGAIFPFAKGGIAANGVPQQLPRFARGGVARSASIFGEAGAEAAVPLPDGRRIPVDLGGVGGGNLTIEGSTVIIQGGADKNTAAEFKRIMDERDRRLMRDIPKMVDSRLNVRQTRGIRA